MQALIQVLKVNEPREGVKDGRAWSMQDAECLLLTDAGDVDQVGVLRIPRDLRGKVAVGTFTGTFSLRADMASRRIEAVLTGLTPVPAASRGK